MTSFRPGPVFFTTSTADLPKIAATLVTLFSNKTVLLLEGPVGAGKTELVKALTRTLGLPETASPSFAIHHRYENPQVAATMDHVDLYRLENEDDLESTGFWDLFSAPQGLVVIEWSDRLNEDLLPLPWRKIRVQIELLPDASHRKLSVFQNG